MLAEANAKAARRLDLPPDIVGRLNAEMVRAAPRSALAPQSDVGMMVLALTRAMVRLPATGAAIVRS